MHTPAGWTTITLRDGLCSWRVLSRLQLPLSSPTTPVQAAQFSRPPHPLVTSWCWHPRRLPRGSSGLPSAPRRTPPATPAPPASPWQKRGSRQAGAASPPRPEGGGRLPPLSPTPPRGIPARSCPSSLTAAPLTRLQPRWGCGLPPTAARRGGDAGRRPPTTTAHPIT